jgi:hypothetical protein
MDTAQGRILHALGRFRFLTSHQMVKAGAVPSVRAAQQAVARMRDTARPLIAGSDAGFIPGLGRLPAMYYLTPAGAEAVSVSLGLLPDIPVRGTEVRHDYMHRVGVVDCLIAFDAWANAHEGELEAFWCYFGRVGKGKGARAATSVQIGNATLTPDAVLKLRAKDGKSRLLVLEVSRGAFSKRVCEKVAAFANAVAEGEVESHFKAASAARYLFVFDAEANLEAVRARLAREGGLGDFAEDFYFHTIEGLERSPLYGWRQIGSNSTMQLF